MAFSDNKVRFLQLVDMFGGLVPRILHDLFSYHCAQSKEFQKTYEDVTWDDSDPHRKWVADKMRRMNISNFTCDRVQQKQIREWDVSNSCAALRVFVDPLPTYVKKVKDARNNQVAHRGDTEVQGDEFDGIKYLVCELIRNARSIIPEEICDNYQAELDTLANTKAFRESVSNSSLDVQRLLQMLNNIMEELQKQGEQGVEWRKELEDLRRKLENSPCLMNQQQVLFEGNNITSCTINVMQSASAMKRKRKRKSSSLLPAKRMESIPMFHPLMNDFVQVRNSFLKDKQPPSHEELTKHFHAYIHARTDMHEQLHVERKLKMAQSYEEVMNILFDCICKWLSFSYLEMIVEAFPNHLLEAREALNRYKEKLREALQMKFDCTERVLKEANVTEDMPPEGMRKVVVRYNLDAGGITLEDVASYRQFLSSILEIPHHLMVLISALYGSLLLEVWIPEELTPRVVRRVEEVWRELWRRKVEGIEVGDRNFDLLQQSNGEKATIIDTLLSMVARAAGQWKGIQSSYGKRLYEEFGRHESLQSCVKKHKEAGCPSPEYLGALEWLLLHHTPEVAEREDRDPLDVLLTTLYLGCCDVEEFVKAVVMCLEDDPVVGQRLQEAFKEFDHAVNQAFTARKEHKESGHGGYWLDPLTQEGTRISQHLEFGSGMIMSMLQRGSSHLTSVGSARHFPLVMSIPYHPVDVLSDKAVTKLYLKYRHMHSLQACVKDSQHLSHEMVEKVKRWFQDHLMEMKEGIKPSSLLLAIVEAGVTDEEVQLELHGMEASHFDYYPYRQRLVEDISKTHQLSLTGRSFPYSQAVFRAVQSFFQSYLAHIHEAVSSKDLLQRANSLKMDVFQLFFVTLAEQKANSEPYRSYLSRTVPPHYQQDLDQALIPAGAFAATEESAPTKGKRVPASNQKDKSSPSQPPAKQSRQLTKSSSSKL